MAARDNGAVDGTEEFLERARREVIGERLRLFEERWRRSGDEVVRDLGAMRCPACVASLRRIHGTPQAPIPGASEPGDEWCHCAGCDVYWRLVPPSGWEWLLVADPHPWHDVLVARARSREAAEEASEVARLEAALSGCPRGSDAAQSTNLV